MSYPGAPGANNHSLPPRPPVPSPAGGFKPAFPPAPGTTPSYPASAPYAASSSISSTPTYPTAHSAAPGSYGAPPPPTHSYPGAPPAVSTGRGGYGAPAAAVASSSYSYPTASYSSQAAYYGAAATTGAYATPPQIRNPFPQPGAAAAAAAAAAVPAAGAHNNQNPFDRSDPNYDPEMAAQIAQWQSAYLPKEGAEPAAGATTAGAAGAGGAGGKAAGPTFNAEAAAKAAQEGATSAAAEKQKTVYREGGGKKWADDTLLEWDPSHLRLFVGNLAGETTDDSLLKAFARWQSVQKAKVIRDKRTNKSKGYGFVSFSDPDDFFQAAKEMNGKYIQSHPVTIRKSTTEIKPAPAKDTRNRGKNFKKKGGKGGGGDWAGGSEGGYSPHLGPVGGGVVKPGQKTKSGLKLLG